MLILLIDCKNRKNLPTVGKFLATVAIFTI